MVIVIMIVTNNNNNNNNYNNNNSTYNILYFKILTIAIITIIKFKHYK